MLKRTIVLISALLAGAALSLGNTVNLQESLLQVRSVYAQDDWEREFVDICSRTQDALSLSVEELKDLVKRCERLAPSIEKLDDTRRKVYLKRLGMCKNLFVFALESKMKED